MTTIIFRGVSFGYSAPDVSIFDDLELLIDSGWRTGLVGRNGRGKTTLLKLVHRALVPQRGEILHALETRYFPTPTTDPGLPAAIVAKQAAGPFADWEGRLAALLADGSPAALAAYGELESRYQQAGGYRIDARIEAELDLLGVAPALRAAPFAQLSGGEQTRVLMAGLFAAPGGYVLIDEPTNHLDLDGRRRMARYLAAKPGFLLVSHDRAFLEAAVDHIVAIESHAVTVHAAQFSVWRQERDARLALEARRNEQLKREARALAVAARQRRDGAARREADKAPHTDKGFIGRRAAKQMKRALVIERRVEQAIETRHALVVHHEKAYGLRFEHAQGRSRTVVEATALTARAGTRTVWRDLSFCIERGERVAVTGRNGCGKTTLLSIVDGARMPVAGTLALAPALCRVRVRQQPAWTRATLRAELDRCAIDRRRYRQVLGALGLPGDLIDQPLERLSPGQQKKLDLALSFARPADLWIWDEPLNYVDLETREQIEEALLRDAPTLLFVEHDAEFVERIATRHLALE